MKKLTLLRHAKSGWDDPVERDFDRPLNKKGKRAAAVMGSFIKRNRLTFDQILASPAVRVIETLENVEDASNLAMEPTWDRKIYLASSATLLDVLRGARPDAEHVLMVGHNPGIGDFAERLVEKAPGHPRFEDYPTGATVVVRFGVEGWSEVKEGTGEAVDFVVPRELVP